jgi:hypothetical protein
VFGRGHDGLTVLARRQAARDEGGADLIGADHIMTLGDAGKRLERHDVIPQQGFGDLALDRDGVLNGSGQIVYNARAALQGRARVRAPGTPAAAARCYEGTEASARAWLEVAAVAYLFARLRTEPA